MAVVPSLHVYALRSTLPVRPLRTSLTLASFLLLPLLLAAGEVRVEAKLGLGGYFRLGGPCPVELHVHNDGASLLSSAEVEGEGSAVTFAREIDIPPGSSKVVRLAALLPTRSPRLSVRLSGPDGLRHSETSSPSLEALTEGSRLIVSTETRRDRPLASFFATCLGDSPERAYLDVEQLPETALAYGIADLVILADLAAASVAPAKRQALLAWVAAGGRLVVSQSGEFRAGSVLHEMLVAHRGQSRMRSGSVRPVEKHWVVAGDDLLPDVADFEFGLGLGIWVDGRLRDVGTARRGVAESRIKELLSTAPRRTPGPRLVAPGLYAVFHRPRWPSQTRSRLFLSLVGYAAAALIMIGLLRLSRSGRLKLLLWSGGLAGLFSALLLSVVLPRRTASLETIAIARARAGIDAFRTDVYSCVAGLSEERVRVVFEAGSWPRPIFYDWSDVGDQAARIERGAADACAEVPLTKDVLRCFVSSSLTQLDGAIHARSQGGRLLVTNECRETLLAAALVDARGAVALSDLQPGQSREIPWAAPRVPVDKLEMPGLATDRKRRLSLRRIVRFWQEAYASEDAAYLLGWIGRRHPGVSVPDALSEVHHPTLCAVELPDPTAHVDEEVTRP